MVILNYNEHYDSLIENGFENRFNIRDLRILIEKWRSQGKNEKAIAVDLDCFLQKWDKGYTKVNAVGKIKKALKASKKDLPKLNSTIYFSQEELDFIGNIESFNEQKVIFSMFVIAKTQGKDYIYLNSNGIIKLKDIFNLANVNLSTQKQEQMLHNLYLQGAIGVNYALKYTVKNVNLENNCGILEFTPSKNSILEYKYYCNKAIKCKICGDLVKKTNNKMKYCKECAKEVKLKQDKMYYDKLRK